MASSPDSASAAADAIRTLGFASGSLSRDDLHDLGAACEAAKEMLVRKAQRLVRASNNMAVLSSKSCDGTPMNVAYIEGLQMPLTKKKFGIHGRRGIEFLVANQFLRTRLATGEWETCVVLAEATPLASKSAPAVFHAAQKHWRTLRSLGHRGPVIEHYVMDRCGLSALERLAHQFHQAQPLDPVYAEDAHFQYLEFVCVTPCALHDAQNGFRWGYAAEFADKQLMRDLYVAIESLRNSADLLSSRVSQWVLSKLRFTESRGEEWQDARRALLSALDVDPEVTQVLVEELELVWEHDQMWIVTGAEVSREL